MPDAEDVHAAICIVNVIENAIEVRLIAVDDLPYCLVFVSYGTHAGRHRQKRNGLFDALEPELYRD